MNFHTRIRLCISLLWDLMLVSLQLVYGVWKISKLDRPIVTIFGGARMPKKDDFYIVQAHKLGALLVKKGISVLTGGGPGIMEAASCGARIKERGEVKIIGIGLKDLRETMQETENKCTDEYFEVNYFFARKWLLTNYSRGLVVFPGGFGTLNELSEALMLIQTKQIPRVPIVLIGTEYWEEFFMWVQGEAFEHGFIKAADISLFTITDDLNVAFSMICKGCEKIDVP